MVHCPYIARSVASSLAIYIFCLFGDAVNFCFGGGVSWREARQHVSASSMQLEFEEFCRIFRGALMNVEFGIENRDILRSRFDECGKFTLSERRVLP